MSRDTESIGDLRDLRAFCLVVDLGSITEAARRLGETKGSVSRRLTRLEQEVSAVLLRRSPRLVQPTDEGAAYRAQAGRALELLDDATAELRGAQTKPRGHLRITAPTDVANALLGPIVARFAEAYPEISLDVLLSERRLDFDADQIDVAIRASSTLEDTTLVAHKLREMYGGFYATREYLKKHGTPSACGELVSHRLVVNNATRGTATLMLKKEGAAKATPVPVRAVVSASDFSFCREVALAGGGLAILPSLIAEPEVEAGRLVRVLTDYFEFSATLYLIHHGTRLLTPKVRAFRDHVLAEFGVRRPKR